MLSAKSELDFKSKEYLTPIVVEAYNDCKDVDCDDLAYLLVGELEEQGFIATDSPESFSIVKAFILDILTKLNQMEES